MQKMFLLLSTLVCAAWSDQGLLGALGGQEALPQGECHKDGSGQTCSQGVPLRDGDAFIQAQVLAKRISGKAQATALPECQMASGRMSCTYMKKSANIHSIEDCRAGCLASSNCHGISYRAASHLYENSQCELWTQECNVNAMRTSNMGYQLESKSCMQCSTDANCGGDRICVQGQCKFQETCHMGEKTAYCSRYKFRQGRSYGSLEECRNACRSMSSCYGINYQTAKLNTYPIQPAMCEFWSQPCNDAMMTVGWQGGVHTESWECMVAGQARCDTTSDCSADHVCVVGFCRKSTHCQPMTPGTCDIRIWDEGEVTELQASSMENCRQACESTGTNGCCEWTRDNKCMILAKEAFTDTRLQTSSATICWVQGAEPYMPAYTLYKETSGCGVPVPAQRQKWEDVEGVQACFEKCAQTDWCINFFPSTSGAGCWGYAAGCRINDSPAWDFYKINPPAVDNTRENVHVKVESSTAPYTLYKATSGCGGKPPAQKQFWDDVDSVQACYEKCAQTDWCINFFPSTKGAGCWGWVAGCDVNDSPAWDFYMINNRQAAPYSLVKASSGCGAPVPAQNQKWDDVEGVQACFEKCLQTDWCINFFPSTSGAGCWGYGERCRVNDSPAWDFYKIDNRW